MSSQPGNYVHPSSYLDQPCEVGSGTRIWHFCHLMKGCVIGRNCVLGQNVHIASDVRIGNGVRIQNNVSVFTGTEIEDDVFLGPSCVLTNILNPRAQVNRHHEFTKTLLRRGCSVGANATIVCGITIGQYAFVAAGTVVTRDVPDYAMMVGVPAKQRGWMSRHGQCLKHLSTTSVLYTCPETGWKYRLVDGRMTCLALAEHEHLPTDMRTGRIPYERTKTT